MLDQRERRSLHPILSSLETVIKNALYGIFSPLADTNRGALKTSFLLAKSWFQTSLRISKQSLKSVISKKRIFDILVR